LIITVSRKNPDYLYYQFRLASLYPHFDSENLLGAIVLYTTDITQYLTKNNKCVGKGPAEINPTPKDRLMVTTCDLHRLREKSTYIFPNKKP